MVEIRKITAVTELLKTKYHGLLHHNDYLAKLCGLVSEVINANTVLMLQDEKDRQSMSLLGAYPNEDQRLSSPHSRGP